MDVAEELETGSGGDSPESQLEAMYQAITGAGRTITADDLFGCGVSIPTSNMNWRADTRMLFLVTDAPFHLPDDEGYPALASAQDVIDAALDENIVINYLLSGTAALDVAGTRIARETGGVFRRLQTDSENLDDVLVEVVTEALEANSLSAQAFGTESDLNTGIIPSLVRGVGSADEPRTFDLTVRLGGLLDLTGREQDVTYRVDVSLGGRDLESFDIRAIVPAELVPGCDNRPPVIRGIGAPSSVTAGDRVTIRPVISEVDDEETTEVLRATAGRVTPADTGFGWEAPATGQVVEMTLETTDESGLSDVGQAPVVVVGGACGGQFSTYELDEQVGDIRMTAPVVQDRADADCGSDGAGEAFFLLHVPRAGEWEFVSASGQPVFIREADCTTDVACRAGSGIFTADLDEGYYVMFAEGLNAAPTKVIARLAE